LRHYSRVILPQLSWRFAAVSVLWVFLLIKPLDPFGVIEVLQDLLDESPA